MSFTDENAVQSQRPTPSRRRALAVLGGGGVVLVAVVLAILFAGGSDQPQAAPAGDPAPAVDLVYLEGGQDTLADLRGTPVVLNFFADWCPACIAEMPDFEQVHQAVGEHVRFIGMDRSLSTEGARALIESTGITYDVALDVDGSIFQSFGGLAMPTTVFIAADGSIVGQHNGVIFAADLATRIDQLFFGA